MSKMVIKKGNFNLNQQQAGSRHHKHCRSAPGKKCLHGIINFACDTDVSLSGSYKETAERRRLQPSEKHIRMMTEHHHHADRRSSSADSQTRTSLNNEACNTLRHCGSCGSCQTMATSLTSSSGRGSMASPVQPIYGAFSRTYQATDVTRNFQESAVSEWDSGSMSDDASAIRPAIRKTKRSNSVASVSGKVPEMYYRMLSQCSASGADPGAGGHSTTHGRRSSIASSHLGSVDTGVSRDKNGNFVIPWARMQDMLLSIRSKMTEHGGYHNVASTYFLLTYSGHGFKHWFLPMGFPRRIFWVVLVLAFVYLQAMLSVQTVMNYLTFPKSVSVSVVDQEEARFPAVTICNFNMLSRSRLNHYMQSGVSKLPKRFEDALNLQRRFEKQLHLGQSTKPNYQSICTESYLRWQSPSLKVAPVQQPFPYKAEEEPWEPILRSQRADRLRKLTEKLKQGGFAFSESDPEEDVSSLAIGKPNRESVAKGRNPCQLMALYGVENGFQVKKWKIKQWEMDTGYNFSQGFRLPEPSTVFQCSQDGQRLIWMNDTALAEICGKAFYDPSSNRPCLSSYFHSDGIPYNLFCFPLNRICDGTLDCGELDDTDETLYCDETGRPNCGKAQNLNRCDNGMCYDKSLHCDGFEDCTDGTDERHCQGLKFDKQCGCYIFCENGTSSPYDFDQCYRVSPFDGVNDGNLEKVMWRAKTAGDFNEASSLLAPSAEEIRTFGVRGQDFIVSCSFDGLACSYKDFFKWQNQEYGNCFTFNSPRLAPATHTDDKVYSTSKYGYKNGLRLSLNIETDDYLSTVTPNRGVRMIIHDRDTNPFPAETGLNLSPLVETAVSLKRKHVQRVPSPHGTCNQSNEDVWSHHFRAKYSSLACNRICFETLIRKKCQCSKLLNPVLQVNDLRICSLSNRTQSICVDKVSKLFNTGDRSIRDEAGPGCSVCAPSCDEWLLELSTSGTIKNKLFQYIFSSVNRVFMTEDFCSGKESLADSSSVHAHVYLDTLSYEDIVESPAYNFQQFISNVGGIWGLFAGFSIITFIEWLEFGLNNFLLFAREANEKMIKRYTHRHSQPS